MTLLSVREIRPSGFKRVSFPVEPREMMAFCPGCKAIQTIWLDGDRLMLTRKFTQVGNKIYHNCSSGQPCRLYQNT